MNNELDHDGMDDHEPCEHAEAESQQAFDDLGLDLGNCPASGDCSIQAAISWCAAHQNDNRAESKDAPGASAWVLHEWLSQAPINGSSFWTNLFSKLISRSSESSSGPRYHDDGSTEAELAARIKAMVAAQSGA